MRRTRHALTAELIQALTRRGPTKGPVLSDELGISQPTLSRLLRENRGRILVVGRARATRYALRRAIPGVASPIPVSEIREPGESPRLLFELHPVEPDGFYAMARAPGETSRFYDDLPFFLQDLRPAGFLGRLVPRQHPELGFPDDILLWSANHTLRYLTEHGWNLVGAIIVGDVAYREYLANVASPPDVIHPSDRADQYARLAADVLRFGLVGSSAAGEQPKFAATIARGDSLTPVLVKFSPPMRDLASIRVADLLVAEHIAHQTLRRYGRRSVTSEIIQAADRVFLELERFDRVGYTHRRGLITLGWLDGEYLGGGRTSWTDSTRPLWDAGVIDQSAHDATRWLGLFGTLIANTDMHHGNLSFYLEGTRVTGLAPAYDMVPMQYRPRQGELVDPKFRPLLPGPSLADISREVWAAATAFWSDVGANSLISPDFRAIGAENASKLEALRDSLDLLPAVAAGLARG
ncbi:MAG: type II toxin-antitoxin system HipA family toxin YjjJ [Deltaproteobacteria bacterium]|nr:type II toxin-antitoxin system HipA family toxin YjjJ [Deltaproteobacteria bacterium]